MRDIRALENHRFRRKLVEIRRMNLYSTIAGKRICALLIRKKQYQVWLSLCRHECESAVNQRSSHTATLRLGERTRLACTFRPLAEIRKKPVSLMEMQGAPQGMDSKRYE
jgi:hypothetical protein